MVRNVRNCIHLTIRLRARDSYAVIVDEGEARINYHRIEIENCFRNHRIVLVESEVKHGIFNKKFDFQAIF